MTQLNIVIVDYGVGNTYSVLNAISNLGYTKIKLSSNEEDIKQANALILPGVGAFQACARNLRDRNLNEILNEYVLIKKKPILGICVGMQLMASISEENGIHEGLNWIPGRVVKLSLPESFSVPHVGWNNVQVQNQDNFLIKSDRSYDFYFDHSFHYKCDEKFVASKCFYAIDIVSSIQKDNIFGVQFHPEKSQKNGLRLFRNFFNMI